MVRRVQALVLITVSVIVLVVFNISNVTRQDIYNELFDFYYGNLYVDENGDFFYAFYILGEDETGVPNYLTPLLSEFNSDSFESANAVTVTLDNPVKLQGSGSFTGTISSNIDKRLYYGHYYTLEKQIGDSWYFINADQGYDAVAINLNSYESREKTYSIQRFLTPGKYRIYETFNYHKYEIYEVCVEFEVTGEINPDRLVDVTVEEIIKNDDGVYEFYIRWKNSTSGVVSSDSFWYLEKRHTYGWNSLNVLPTSVYTDTSDTHFEIVSGDSELVHYYYGYDLDPGLYRIRETYKVDDDYLRNYFYYVEFKIE